jgi:predicted enzyme related to lactoylglutathione lyase
MLKKIDCVMIRVDDVETAVRYYSDVFGLCPLWRDETSVGLGLPDTDAEIVLHCNPDVPAQVEVYYLVDDVASTVRIFEQRGCQVLNGPFEIPIGKGAVITDPFGTRLCILDMTKGPRKPIHDGTK